MRAHEFSLSTTGDEVRVPPSSTPAPLTTVAARRLEDRVREPRQRPRLYSNGASRWQGSGAARAPSRQEAPAADLQGGHAHCSHPLREQNSNCSHPSPCTQLGRVTASGEEPPRARCDAHKHRHRALGRRHARAEQERTFRGHGSAQPEATGEATLHAHLGRPARVGPPHAAIREALY